MASLEEDHQLQSLQEMTHEEVGQRKTVAPTAIQASTSIFVGNLDPRATEADLKSIFRSCGNVKRVTIIKDHNSHESKGFAYVEFDNEEAMTKALLLDNQGCYGRPI